MIDLATKYDRLAEGFAETEYANIEYEMQRRRWVAVFWGPALESGDAVLELGCGDGYLAELLVRGGFLYRGVDISPKMIACARRRLRDRGLEAPFDVSDVDEFALNQSVDVVVSHMGDFFRYARDPLGILKRFRPQVRKKVILDLNPRKTPIRAALAVLRDSGFRQVTWRPYFVPKERKLPLVALKALAACEAIPVLSSIPLRWKFQALVKGEVGT